MMLLAQTTTITPSGNLTDPAAWGDFIDHGGEGTFILVFLVLVLAFLAWKWGNVVVSCLFGEKGAIERFLNWLEAVKENQDRVATIFDRHVNKCETIHAPGGPCNVVSMKDAGHEFAEMGRKLGKKLDVDVDDEADNIHRILRGVSVPQ